MIPIFFYNIRTCLSWCWHNFGSFLKIHLCDRFYFSPPSPFPGVCLECWIHLVQSQNLIVLTMLSQRVIRHRGVNGTLTHNSSTRCFVSNAFTLIYFAYNNLSVEKHSILSNQEQVGQIRRGFSR